MSCARIKAVAVHHPERIVSNEEVVARIKYPNIDPTILTGLLGCESRRYAAKESQVSDLAVAAAKEILNENGKTNIDLLIFSAASSDLIEPATANIVQHKLGLNCPVMDIKNACNSFVSAIHTGSAFIQSGIYNNVLIVNGEKLSEVINFNPKDRNQLMRSIAGYSLGDAGAAMLLSSEEGSEIVYQNFLSIGKYWDLCTVEGGGSMAYWDRDKYFFEVDAKGLRDVILAHAKDFVLECLNEAKWKVSDINCIAAHLVSASTTHDIAQQLNISPDLIVNTFKEFGNTAAATIPLALNEAVQKNKIKKGDKVMLLGLAAGISISVQLIEW